MDSSLEPIRTISSVVRPFLSRTSTCCIVAHKILRERAQTMNRNNHSSSPELFDVILLMLAAAAIQGCSMISDIANSSAQIQSASVRKANYEISRPSAISKLEIGAASWYGPGFNGKATASGDIFDDRKFTAAHRTLPLGSKARVVNLNNGKSVEVVINDRGPHVQGRIIDLSQASAKALGMIDCGITQVKVQLIQETVASDHA